MVHTLDRPNTAAPGADDNSGEAELPTNRLNSTNLQETHIAHNSTAESNLQEIDWVRTLTSINPVTQQFTDDEPDPQPAPSGMGHHITGPSRMVPARRSLIPDGVKRALITLLFIATIGGALGAGVYVLVESGSLDSLFASQPAIVSNPVAQATPQAQPPAKQAPTEVPQPIIAGNPNEMRDKGIEQYNLGNFDKAIELLEGVVSAGTNDARTYYHLGLAYLAVTGHAHSLDDAELAFRTAVSLDPSWAAAHNMLAESLVRRGYYAEAIPEGLEATGLDPNSGEAWMTLSRAYKGAGQEGEATRAYAEAARLAPVPPQP